MEVRRNLRQNAIFVLSHLLRYQPDRVSHLIDVKREQCGYVRFRPKADNSDEGSILPAAVTQNVKILA